MGMVVVWDLVMLRDAASLGLEVNFGRWAH